MNPQQIFERYVWAGALTRNASALADLFTPDGVFEAPLVPPDGAFPARLVGREAIRAGFDAYYTRTVHDGRTANAERSGYVLHTTADPDVFIAEIDSVLDGPDGSTTMSLVQIFRLRDGKLARVRDYFAHDGP